jgi:hypothetical protein
MLTRGRTEARKLRARLKHPIIDADGHWAANARVEHGRRARPAVHA